MDEINIYYWNGIDFVEVNYNNANTLPGTDLASMNITFDSVVSSKFKIKLPQQQQMLV